MDDDKYKVTEERPILPVYIGAVAFVFYAVTLNKFVSLESLPAIARVADWDWWLPNLESPLLYLVTLPFKLLPAGLQPVALNLFSAACSAITLGLLARAVTLLPQDRTHDQRLRLGKQGKYEGPLWWIAPVLAAVAIGLQSTFWKHAVNFTGESLNLLIFAYIVHGLLVYRIQRDDKQLARIVFVYGLGITNNWALIGFLPLFIISLIWIRGISSLNFNFLARMAGIGALGLLLYFLFPIKESLFGKLDITFWQALKTQLVAQKNILLNFPKSRTILCCLTSLLPLVFISIRWSSKHGDTTLIGNILMRILGRLIHAVFLGLCLWVMFDPPFSPKAIGYGLPFLTFYFITALVIGYLVNYFLVLALPKPVKFGKSPEVFQKFLSPLVQALFMIIFLIVTVGLKNKNFPDVWGNNGRQMRLLAEMLCLYNRGIPQNSIILSDDPVPLVLMEALSEINGIKKGFIPVDTRSMPYKFYHKILSRRFPDRWNGILSTNNLPEPIQSRELIGFLNLLAQNNRIYYLHPSFGYYFEDFYIKPYGFIFELQKIPSGEGFFVPRLTNEEINENNQFWNSVITIKEILKREAALDEDEFHQPRDRDYVGSFVSRSLNWWGVALARNGKTNDAKKVFEVASFINPDNLASWINLNYSQTKKVSLSDSEIAAKSKKLAQKYGTLDNVLRQCGPFDEPGYCLRVGNTFAIGSLLNQASIELARACELDPDNIDAHISLANVVLNLKKPDLVLKMVGELRTKFAGRILTPEQTIKLAQLEAWSYFEKSNLNRAIDVISNLFKVYPKESEVPATLSQLYLAAGQVSNAIAAMDAQLQINPNDVRALLNKSAFCIREKRYDEAIDALNRLLAIEPGATVALLNRAIAFLQMGKLDLAQKDYEEIMKKEPTAFPVYYGLGEIAFVKNDMKKAAEYYEQFLKLAPSNTIEIPKAKERLRQIKGSGTGK